MKKIILVAITLLAFNITTFSGTNYVYICSGYSATKYHAYSNCRGLNRCKGEIYKKSIKEANGYSPCKICY
jgi:hypothetical protein